MIRTPVTVIVLAAQRDGLLDPLAEAAGVTHKCLVPIGGRPLLAHVLEALARVEAVRRIRISVEPGAADRLRPILDEVALEAPVDFVAAESTITDSVYAAAAGDPGPFVITTADNVLLTAAAVDEMITSLAAGEDAVVALARREDVLAAHPQGQRRFYRFTDASYSNCNLYGVSEKGLKLAETYRSGGQFAKNPKRILKAVGLINLILLRFKWLSLPRAMKRLGRRFGVRAHAVILEDGTHAIDVDNERTYAIAAQLLESRAG